MKALNRLKYGIMALSILIAGVIWVTIVEAAPKQKTPETVGRSDLNRDGVVDYADLVIFSTDYLGETTDTVDWCAFSEATALQDTLYDRQPSFYTKHFGALLSFINTHFGCDRSDLNNDGTTNTDDLAIFSDHFLELNWETVDWCAFYIASATGQTFNGKHTTYYAEHFKTLISFIKDYSQCETGPLLLTIENKPKSLMRIAAARDGSGSYYITDPRVNSVFIYNADFLLIGELKNLDTPLGIAIDSQGFLLVGNDGRNNIEVYDPADGVFLTSFGDGLIKTPNAITIGPNGKIFVTDSGNHNIRVFDPAYVSLNTIGSQGEGDIELTFPTDSAIVTHMEGSTPVHELYVTDQGNERIQIYDLEGNYLNALYGLKGRCGMMGCLDPIAGSFKRLRAIEIDALGRLHLLDIFEAKVAILHPVTGALMGAYGQYGKGTGAMRAPLDLLLTNENTALITDARSTELEVFLIP